MLDLASKQSVLLESWNNNNPLLDYGDVCSDLNSHKGVLNVDLTIRRT